MADVRAMPQGGIGRTPSTGLRRLSTAVGCIAGEAVVPPRCQQGALRLLPEMRDCAPDATVPLPVSARQDARWRVAAMRQGGCVEGAPKK